MANDEPILARAGQALTDFFRLEAAGGSARRLCLAARNTAQGAQLGRGLDLGLVAMTDH